MFHFLPDDCERDRCDHAVDFVELHATGDITAGRVTANARRVPQLKRPRTAALESSAPEQRHHAETLSTCGL
jgi:hypothetical protein